jgi:hypothetical protein
MRLRKWTERPESKTFEYHHNKMFLVGGSHLIEGDLSAQIGSSKPSRSWSINLPSGFGFSVQTDGIVS